MANKTKQQLIVENNTNFPTNNAGAITADDLRNFNTDMIDSTVNQEVYTTDSQSFDSRIDQSIVTASLIGDILTFTKDNGSEFGVTITGATIPPGTISGSEQITQLGFVSSSITGSSIVTASAVDNVMTFTKGDSSTFNVVVGSIIPGGTISGSSQVILQQTTGNLSGSRIDGLVSSASFAISASHSEFSDNSFSASYALSSSHSELADNSTFSIYADNTIVYGKNVHSTTIPKGTPLYFTGSGTAGNLVGILPADAGNPLLMPAGGIAGETIDVGLEGIVILDGFINQVDTTPFQPGDEVFVAVGGGYTNVPPTGSNNLIQSLGYVEKSAVNGSGVIQMSGEARAVPNIQEGYTWVGNGNGVATPSTTQSIVEHIFTQDNTFTGTQTFNNISVDGTGSFAYIQSVTGSAKVIGDAFIILNNDTPTERYAGLIVIDSGSTLASASFQFDGLTNDWFYEYTSANDPDNFGVALFGPEYGTKGSPIYNTNNRIVKSDGKHHILDSNISDDGSTVSINSNTQVTGSLSVNGEGVITESDLNSLNNFTQSAQGRLSNIELTTQSLQSQVDGLSNETSSYALSASVAAVDAAQQQQIDSLISVTGSFVTSSTDITSLNAFTASQIDLNGTFATTGSNTFVGNQVISGSVDISGSLSINNDIFVSSSDIFLTGSGASFINILQPSPGEQSSAIRFYSGSTIDQTGIGGQIRVSGNGNSINIGSFGAGETSLVDFDFQNLETLFSQNLRVVGSKDFRVVGSGSDEFSFLGPRGVLSLSSGSSDITFSAANPLANTINRGTTEPILIDIYNAESTLSISITATGSFIQDFSSVTNVNENAIKLQPYSDYQRGQVTILRDLDVSGSLSVSGSINNSVNTLTITSNTASIDASVGNTFQLNLVSGSNTRLEVSNVKSGQTLNLLVSQSNPFGGTLTLAENLLEPSGSEYSASLVNGAQDILTLASFVRTDVMYVANINNLI